MFKSIIYNIVPFRTPYPKIVPQNYMHASAQVMYQCYMLESARGTYNTLHLFECMSYVPSVVIFMVMRAPPCFFYMVRIAQRHHDVLIFVLGCAGHSNFVGGVPSSHVISQFLIKRQYRDGCSLCEHSSLMCAIVFKLTRDCTGYLRSYFRSRSTKFGAGP